MADENIRTSIPNGVGLNDLIIVDKDGNEFKPIEPNNTTNLNELAQLLDGLIQEYKDTDYTLSDLNTALLEEIEKDKFRMGDVVGDVNIKNYSFDGNNNYAMGDSGVEIDGFLFFPEEVKGDESFARRDYKRTSIMSGGEFVTRGQYKPKEFSFTTTLDIDPNQPYMYDTIFQIMENKPCEVISPYMGDIFKAEVHIDKTHPKASPSNLKLDIKVKEIVEPKTTVVGDTALEYPSTTTLSEKAVNIKKVSKKKDEKKDKKQQEKEQITYDGLAKDGKGQEYVSPYD